MRGRPQPKRLREIKRAERRALKEQRRSERQREAVKDKDGWLNPPFTEARAQEVKDLKAELDRIAIDAYRVSNEMAAARSKTTNAERTQAAQS